MYQGKHRQSYRIRVRRPDGGWIIGGTRYAKIKADRLRDALQVEGHVAHVDETGRGWHGKG